MNDTAGPLPVGDRIEILDVLRGAAILGILFYNVGALSGWDFTAPAVAQTLPGARFDAWAVFTTEFLVQGKFYALFSFLFGISFAVFLRRAQARGAQALRLIKRRLTGLMLIGLAHSAFLWYGDILLTYALIGFCLIPFIGRNNRHLLCWGLAALLSPIVLYALLAAGLSLAAVPGGGDGSAPPPMFTEAIRAFASGSYGEVVAGNIAFTAMNFARRLVLMFYPRVFGMFLLGFWAGRVNLFADLDANAPLLRRFCLWGFSIGLPLAFWGAWLGGSATPRLPAWEGLLEMIVETAATPALALAYAGGIGLLFRLPLFRKILAALAPVGRTALSNYLLQSVAGLLIFYGIGLGWFGKISLAAMLAGSTLFFLMQICISRWWLLWAAHGPVEWVWRLCTYGRLMPLARRPPAP